ncbi:transcriptional regulator,LysM domain-containing protein [Streptomyces hygroscopicus]|nr:bacterial transcriptional activator domain-containing protein [Streptomyces hygroscopicus]AQW46670.1 transcriptional regulator,LysM domain-containing protein [Streptomyces hygroscopicus]
MIVRQDGPYTLDPERVSVDLWKAYKSLDAARSGHSNEHRLAALQCIGELYRGDLAEDVTAEWIEAPREALRRDVLDAFSALAHTIDDTDPERALILLERARTLDRYNQALYEGIARLQARLGQQDAITRTLALLTKTLAEIGEHPSQETVAFCAFLQRRRPTNRSRDQAS